MSTNLITFPDWTKPEELLYEDLVNLIKNIAHQYNTNLWVDITGISQEEAELWFYSVTTSLILEQGLEINDSLQLSFMGNLNQEGWKNLARHIHQRIYLNCDSNSAPIDNEYFCPVCENAIINFLPLPKFYLDNLSKYKLA
jgi:hypothetical protein